MRPDMFEIACEAMHGLLSASKKEVGKTDFDAISEYHERKKINS